MISLRDDLKIQLGLGLVVPEFLYKIVIDYNFTLILQESTHENKNCNPSH